MIHRHYSDALEAYEEALRLFEKLRDDVAAAELRVWIDRIRQSLPGYKGQEEANWPDDRGWLAADWTLPEDDWLPSAVAGHPSTLFRIA
jgi:hypothetical protein